MERDALSELRRILSSRLSQEEIEAWLHTRNSYLAGRTPLDALAVGDIQAVEQAASELAGSETDS